MSVKMTHSWRRYLASALCSQLAVWGWAGHVQSLFIWGRKQRPTAAASNALILMREKQNNNAALVKPEPLKEAETFEHVHVVSVRTWHKEKQRHHFRVIFALCLFLQRTWQKRTSTTAEVDCNLSHLSVRIQPVCPYRHVVNSVNTV